MFTQGVMPPAQQALSIGWLCAAAAIDLAFMERFHKREARNSKRQLR
jgi:hypothetical protein